LFELGAVGVDCNIPGVTPKFTVLLAP